MHSNWTKTYRSTFRKLRFNCCEERRREVSLKHTSAPTNTSINFSFKFVFFLRVSTSCTQIPFLPTPVFIYVHHQQTPTHLGVCEWRTSHAFHISASLIALFTAKDNCNSVQRGIIRPLFRCACAASYLLVDKIGKVPTFMNLRWTAAARRRVKTDSESHSGRVSLSFWPEYFSYFLGSRWMRWCWCWVQSRAHHLVDP